LCYAALRQEQATYNTAQLEADATSRAAKRQEDATYRSLLYNKQVDIIGATFQSYEDIIEKIAAQLPKPTDIIMAPADWSRPAIHSWFADISKLSQTLANQSDAVKMVVPDDVRLKLKEAADSVALLIIEVSPPDELFPSLMTPSPEEVLFAHKQLAASAQFGSLMTQAPLEALSQSPPSPKESLSEAQANHDRWLHSIDYKAVDSRLSNLQKQIGLLESCAEDQFQEGHSVRGKPFLECLSNEEKENKENLAVRKARLQAERQSTNDHPGDRENAAAPHQ
jgi:hypothetical protein